MFDGCCMFGEDYMFSELAAIYHVPFSRFHGLEVYLVWAT